MAGAGTIEDRFNAIAGRLNATHAELVDLTVEVLEDPNIWGSWECHSVDKFVAWRGRPTNPGLRSQTPASGPTSSNRRICDVVSSRAA